jgi:3-phenylpropionate/trans-cinnamate dioxygenase ferredoxin component
MWTPVAASDEVAEGLPMSVVVDDRRLGVYRVDGTVYALEDVCPHAHVLLSHGVVHLDEVECPLHGARFHVATGACRRGPKVRDLHTYQACENDGTIFVEI